MTPIAIDVTAAIVGNTGVARYAVHLPDALEALGVDLRRFAVGRMANTDPRIRHLRVPLRVMTKVWRTGHPRVERLVGGPVSLVHSLDLVPPPTRAPRILTVHDLGALERPELHSPLALAAGQRQLAAARSVDLVCTDTAAIRQSLIERGVAADVITVVPIGVTPLPAANGPPLREPGYVLMVGTLTPRKGFDVMVTALEALPDVRLIIAGPDAFRTGELMARIEASPVRDRIERLGFVTDAELATLLRDAGCQVMPSRVEGFGIPVLEAMDKQVPLVCSDIPALREVGGDYPTYVPVDDPAALADAVSTVLAGSRSTEGGPALAAAFSWERAARAAAGAYEQVLGHPVI